MDAAGGGGTADVAGSAFGTAAAGASAGLALAGAAAKKKKTKAIGTVWNEKQPNQMLSKV